ncbi:MAG: tetratricopeptide repeat protein [Rhodospirillaceae bacterium]|nr:tetratricopeptide repeat protein [Rhodospirillaceae bacterium]
MGDTKTLTAFYDLRCAPYHFDFIFVAVMADAVRLDRDCSAFEMIIVPDQGSALNCIGHRHSDQFSADQANWRMANIFLPALALLPNCTGLTVCASRSQAQAKLDTADGPIFPDGYSVEAPPERYWTNDEFSMLANMGVEIPGLQAPQQALDYVDSWIESHAGNRKVVSITLRESGHDTAKNSDLAIWRAFAARLDPEKYFPVFLPDMDRIFTGAREDLPGFTTFNEAVANLILRCAFYERCYITMMVTQGPSTICYMNGNIRYIIVKSTPPELSASYPPYPIALGLDVGEPWPHASPYQRRVEEPESLELLEREFQRMVDLIELEPASALSRHEMRRHDAGPDNIARISRLFALLPFMPRAVVICQMYLDRNPDDLDVLRAMARGDLMLQHQNPNILARSQALYEAVLRNHPDEILLKYALTKVQIIKGGADDLDWLIESSAEIEENINADPQTSEHETGPFDFLLSLASMFARLDRANEAIHVSQAAVRLKPTIDRVTNLAVILEAVGRIEEAKDLLLQLADQGVLTALTCETLGRIFKSLGEPGLAVEYIQKAAELSAVEIKSGSL